MLSRKNNNAHPADYDREQWTTASWVTEFRRIFGKNGFAKKPRIFMWTNAAYETQIFNFLKALTKNVFLCIKCTLVAN